MPQLEINGRSVTVEDGLNLIQAADRLDIEIPHYCYHPGLTIAGNCRMCLVEIEKMPKLQIACNTLVADGMVVRTDTERVRRANQAVLEFLLINHPIDCPVCDQAGECKLQDYYMDYDRAPSRFPLEAKVKKHKALDIGPLVMLDQERCILCTRCVRFVDEVTKTSELGVFERGDHCLIDLFPGKLLDNPYSGNVVDICPVGALTSKDFRFRARVWYLDQTPSVCPTCATGCNIDIHHRGGEMFRFRPRENQAVNQYWMCDEGRLSYKRFQGEGRLLQPVVHETSGWSVQPWTSVLDLIIERLREVSAESGGAIGGIVSAQVTNEEAFLFNRFVSDVLGGRVAGHAWSPEGATHDDFLIDADKNPNTAGIRALRVPLTAEELIGQARAGTIRALLLLRVDLGPVLGEEALKELAKKLSLLVVLDTHYHQTAESAQVLLPIATFAETDGTFVNRAGRVQRVRPACGPPAGVRPGWRVLTDLLHRNGGTDTSSAEAVFAQLVQSASAFRGLSYHEVGLLGAPLSPAGV